MQLARKGQHAIRDANVKSGTRKSIVEYEQLESVLRDERAQQAELDCLNYLAQKNLIELSKKVPTEADVSKRMRIWRYCHLRMSLGDKQLNLLGINQNSKSNEKSTIHL